MTYLFSIFCLVAIFICFSAVFHFWENYRRTHLWQFKNYAIGFLFISIAYAILSLITFISDSTWAQIALISVDLSFAGTIFYFIPILLSFSEKYFLYQKKISAFWLGGIVVYILFNILFFSPAVPLFSDGEFYYWRNSNFLLHSIFWILFTFGAGANGVLFLSSLKIASQDKKLFLKSLLLGVSSLFIFIAGMLFWYFKFFNSTPSLLIASGIIGDIGFIMGAASDAYNTPS